MGLRRTDVSAHGHKEDCLGEPYQHAESARLTKAHDHTTQGAVSPIAPSSASPSLVSD